jgi:hypothetical protein
MDMGKAIEALRKYLTWKNDPSQHRLNESTLPLLQQGVFYTFGRDKQYRPVIYLMVHQINLKLGV